MWGRGVADFTAGLGGIRMILASLAGAMLVVSVATGPIVTETQGATSTMARQKSATIEPLINTATACIARAVASDPRLRRDAPSNLGDLIVESVPGCMPAVRAMIEGYDSAFGEGAGEAYFLGPYLDVLPGAVSKWVADVAP
jgi:hypothetical protein